MTIHQETGTGGKDEYPYAVQLHIHSSASEGRASMHAHDAMAAKTGIADAIWWTDHDWRLANFCKVGRFDFDEPEEKHSFPARIAQNGLPPVLTPVTWEPDEEAADAPDGRAEYTTERSYDGRGSLKLSAQAPGTVSRRLSVCDA